MIDLYTDGSFPRAGGSGGWAFAYVHKGCEFTASGAISNATNNRMELLAVIKGLEHLLSVRSIVNSHHNIIVHSDSQYVVRGINEWMRTWKRHGWYRKDADGEWVPIKNPDLWRMLDRLIKGPLMPEFVWVRGHQGEYFNELVDRLAGEAVWELIENQ